MILKDWYTDPELVKRVSYFSVSVVMEILASAEVIKVSFLQEKKNNKQDKRIRVMVLITVKIAELFEISEWQSKAQQD